MIENTKASHLFIHLVTCKPSWKCGARRFEERVASRWYQIRRWRADLQRKAVELLVSGECQFEIWDHEPTVKSYSSVVWFSPVTLSCPGRGRNDGSHFTKIGRSQGWRRKHDPSCPFRVYLHPPCSIFGPVRIIKELAFNQEPCSPECCDCSGRSSFPYIYSLFHLLLITHLR